MRAIVPKTFLFLAIALVVLAGIALGDVFDPFEPIDDEELNYYSYEGSADDAADANVIFVDDDYSWKEDDGVYYSYYSDDPYSVDSVDDASNDDTAADDVEYEYDDVSWDDSVILSSSIFPIFGNQETPRANAHGSKTSGNGNTKFDKNVDENEDGDDYWMHWTGDDKTKASEPTASEPRWSYQGLASHVFLHVAFQGAIMGSIFFVIAKLAMMMTRGAETSSVTSQSRESQSPEVAEAEMSLIDSRPSPVVAPLHVYVPPPLSPA